MIALDLPPNEMIAIEYVGLAQASVSAELQKDVLRRAISEILPTIGGVVEASDASANQSKAGLFIKCVSCDVKADVAQSVIRVEEDERLRGYKNLSRSQFKIFIQSPNKPAQVWNVEIGKRTLGWYPLLKADAVATDQTLASKYFVVQTCIEGVNCPQTQIFKSLNECNQKIQSWSGRRVDSAQLRNLNVKDLFITTERIPFINEVRANSTVRASIVSRENSLRIRVPAKALKSGGLGDIVSVETLTNSNSIQKSRLHNARVTGEGEVEIVR